jgi:predicted AAA+ superfamily ATPase
MGVRKTATLDDVWAIIAEIGEIQKEFAEDMKAVKESQKENAAQLKELANDHKELKAIVKELSINFGGLGNSLGDLAEGLMASELVETFEKRGLYFDRSFQNYKVKEKITKRKLAEIDMLLVNGTIAMAVEVKTTMKEVDVDKHEARMDLLSKEPDSLFLNRKLYGAMAGVKMSTQAREYAIEKGFFVIELTGDAIKVDMPDSFTPKIW